MEMQVFVVGLTGKRLMPTTPRKARILLKEKKAEVFCKRPFTIRLLYKTGGATQPVSLGIDTGSQHIGVAVVTNNKAVFQAEIELRDSMEKRKLMESRKEFRRSRRYRKTRYRHPKFRFHTKRVYSEKTITRNKHKTHWVKKPNKVTTTRKEGWLPPSIKSKVNHHFNWIDRFLDVLPADTKLSLEVARFDIERMKDPTIHGEMYQKGPQYDYENLKAYVFARDGYKCKCCGAKLGSQRKSDGTTVKGILHHIDFRSKGATNNPARLVTVCDACHTRRNHQPGGKLYEWCKDEKEFSRGYRDATFMSILRKRMFACYPDARFTYGNITAADRKRLLLSKSHANDAVAIAAYDKEAVSIVSPVLCYRQIRKKKRSLHEANPRKGRNKPNRAASRNVKNMKYSRGISIWDKVQVDNKVGWVSGFSNKGLSVYIKDKDNKYLIPTGTTAQFYNISSIQKVMTHNNNWLCFTKPIGAILSAHDEPRIPAPMS